MADESITGRVTEDNMESVEDLIDRGAYKTKSEFVRFAVRYTLSEKHDS